MKATNKRKKPITKIICLLAVLALLTACAVEFFGMRGTEVKVNIKPGTGAAQIYNILKENKVIGSTFLFGLYAKAHTADFKSGWHTMYKGMGYKAALEELLQIAPQSPDERMITFAEGLEMREMADILEENGIVRAGDFISAANEKYDYDFLPPAEEGYLEGYLFPDTYSLSSEMTSEDVINIMLRRFGQVFGEGYKKRAEEIGMSIHEVVTLASIIEREAARDDERALVSSVFHNRLKSTEYPRLESCATVQYILKERKDVLSNADTAIDSPYNTYMYPGLPKGPIASPGERCIEAALYPADTDYYFFVSNGDGTQTFSKTYDGHMRSGVNAR